MSLSWPRLGIWLAGHHAHYCLWSFLPDTPGQCQPNGWCWQRAWIYHAHTHCPIFEIRGYVRSSLPGCWCRQAAQVRTHQRLTCSWLRRRQTGGCCASFRQLSRPTDCCVLMSWPLDFISYNPWRAPSSWPTIISTLPMFTAVSCSNMVSSSPDSTWSRLAGCLQKMPASCPRSLMLVVCRALPALRAPILLCQGSYPSLRVFSSDP